MSCKVYIFIDNSNLLHQGQQAIPGLLGLTHIVDSIQDLGFDYQSLVECILSGRESGGECVLVVSTPSPLESEWDQLPKTINVLKFPKNKEKSNDVALAVEAAKIIFSRPPGILALVLGDGDYLHLVNKAIENGWRVELYFWSGSECESYCKCLEYVLKTKHAGASKSLCQIPSVKLMTLDQCAKFAYAYTGNGASSGTFAFDVTHDDIKTLSEHTHIFEITKSFDSFSWWTLLSKTSIRFMFAQKARMKSAMNVLQKAKPDWIIFEHTFPGNKRKHSSTHGTSSYNSNTSRSVKSKNVW